MSIMRHSLNSYIIENMFADVAVDGAKWVVEQINVRHLVDGSG